MARNAGQIVAGVGLLYVGPASTAAPTERDDALAAGFREVGYTDAGATITTSVTTENLEVAEELEPVGVSTTSRTGSVNFAMAQLTAENLKLALNLGAPAGANSTDVISPPSPEDELYVSLVLQTAQGARWYFPKVKNAAEFSLPRQKTGKTILGVEMNIFKVAGSEFFYVWPTDDFLV